MIVSVARPCSGRAGAASVGRSRRLVRREDARLKEPAIATSHELILVAAGAAQHWGGVLGGAAHHEAGAELRRALAANVDDRVEAGVHRAAGAATNVLADRVAPSEHVPSEVERAIG